MGRLTMPSSRQASRPKSNRRRPLVAVLLLLGWACYGDVHCTNVQEPAPTITGRWSGLTSVGIVPEAWRFELTESPGGRVTGTVSAEGAEQVRSGTVDGRHSYPQVTLSLELTIGDREETGTYNGHLVEDEYNTIRGELALGDDPVRTLTVVRGR